MKKREIYFNARYHPAVGVFRQRHDARRVTFERLMCVEIADRSASYINNIRGGGFMTRRTPNELLHVGCEL